MATEAGRKMETTLSCRLFSTACEILLFEGLNEELASPLGVLDRKVSRKFGLAVVVVKSILSCSWGFRRSCLSSLSTSYNARAASVSVNTRTPRVPKITSAAGSANTRGNIIL